MSCKFERLNKEDLIKHIAESLEKTLPEGLEYNFPSVQTTTGLVVDKNSTIGNLKIIRKEFEIKINFFGMVGKGLAEGSIKERT